MKLIKSLFLVSFIFIFILVFLVESVSAQEDDYFEINNYCIGRVCIGDTLKIVKDHYKDCIIKVNDSDTGYYIFDNLGNFLIEFSTKKSINDENEPIRYIMTSNPNFSFEPGNISLETKVSELIDKYGQPNYESGPNGYQVSFSGWPIKNTSEYHKYQVNLIVGIYNPKLNELFNFSGTINEKAELKLLKSYPDYTYLNTFEIFSDHYNNGNPIP
ncbi:MAG: hypothetical protein AB1782_01140 [Cyanobacteriota bacterium]